MPLYEYYCRKCGSSFSLIQKIGAGEEDTQCHRCGGKDVKKMVSSFSCASSHSGLSQPSVGGHSGGS